MDQKKFPRLGMTPRVHLSQHIDRHWMPHLSPPEYKVVRLIYDRTFAWGRWTEEISIREFRSGRRKYTNGTGLSESTVYRVLQTLKARGIIFGEAHPGVRSKYGLDPFWKGTDDHPIRFPNIDWDG